MDKKEIVDATGQEDPGRIFKIELTNRSITAINGLKQFDKVRCLILSYNLIERIQNLQCCPDLRELHMENNCLRQIAGLENNKSLQVLNLANNNIEKIQNLGHLIKLESLNLNNNRIGRLNGLQYLKQLKSLSVCKNKLESIEMLPTFSKLASLLLSHNKIKHIPTNLFMSSKALLNLDLSHNSIQLTNFLQYLSSLQILNLSHNSIKYLQLPSMPNLQSLNASHNDIGKLPAFTVCSPELISLDISHNFICSEHELLLAISQNTYLTELDFRQNPLCSQSFEIALQRIHSFDFLNGQANSKAGAKYYEQIYKIKKQIDENGEFYGTDDEDDRKLKMSGFEDDQLQYTMSGLKPTRARSPKRKKNFEKPTFYDDLEKSYHEFMDNHHRINRMREQYLKICGNYNIVSQNLITEVPLASQRETVQEPEPKTLEKKTSISQQLLEREEQLRRQNDKNLNKWKELKNKQLKTREKSFKIRDVLKSRGKEGSINKGNSSSNAHWNSSSNAASTILKQQRQKSELFKTQLVPRKIGDQLLRTIARPSSMRRRE